MKKLHKFALATGLTVATLASLNSCKSREQKAAEAEKARQEQLAEQQRQEREHEALLLNEAEKAASHVRDSVLNALGYRYVNDGWTDEYVARDLENRTQMNVLVEQVDTMINQKAKQYADKITSVLNKYGLCMPGVNRYGEDATSKQNNILKDYCLSAFNDYRFVIEAKKQGEEIKDLGIDARLPYGMFGEKFDWGEYGESRRREVKTAVVAIFDEMCQDIIRTVPQITKKFAKYYPIFDLSKIPAEYAKYFPDPNGWWIHPESGECFLNGAICNGDLVVSRRVRVYDSQLPVDFFGEDADYKLVKVAEGKWQVVRTDKSGKVSKTKVFTHNTDYETYGSSYETNYDKSDVGTCSFSFEPGVNMGVSIFVNELVFVQPRQIKDDKCPDPDGRIAARVDSLRAVSVSKKAEYDRMSAIRHHADSLAQVAFVQYKAKHK